eukprot:TRINITY_DN16230_c0_g1_i1.p1 TRINITY_DN16230_c0_g1~~TRINITY_DN16230_c0_g1_i1.p1  ORF type:complete len:270 (+),score=31.87 TRINITY_DN16230_c0_g1_i1:162-971(+)
MIILFMVLAGLILTLSPAINTAIRNEDLFTSDSRIWWTIGFFLAMLPNAVVNILQEKFLKLRNREDQNAGVKRRILDILTMLACCSGVQLVLGVVLVCMDTIPHYGLQPSYEDISATVKEAGACIFQGTPAGCENSWWYAMLFILGCLIVLTCMAGLNETSAQYSMLVTSPAVALVGIIYSALPLFAVPSHYDDPLGNVDHSASGDSTDSPTIAVAELWASIPAFVMLLAATVWWRVWESTQRRRLFFERYGHHTAAFTVQHTTSASVT